MYSRLQLGCTKADITPEEPLPLAGFKHRSGVFEGVAHPLYARIFAFRQKQEGGKHKQLLLVCADFIWWGSDRIAIIRQRLRARFGLEPEDIVLHATHTHSGPQTSSRFAPSLGTVNPDYISQIEERLLEAAAAAFDSAEDVVAEQGEGRCSFGIHRRKRVDGEIVMAPNEDGPVDPEVKVIRFCTPDKRTKALLVHYTCHPTVTDANFVSSEFPGVAMELLERQFGPGVVAAFLQGCCGDVRPALIEEGEFYRGDDSDVRHFAAALADEAAAIIRRPMRAAPPCSIGGRQLTIPLSFERLPSREKLEAALHEEDIKGEWSALLLREPERLTGYAELELTLLHLAEGLSIMAMNAEMVVAYGLYVKSLSGGSVIPAAYSNGMIGYVPAASQLAEGGYEAEGSAYYFGLPGPFRADIEEAIRGGIRKLVAERSSEKQ